MSDPYTAIAEHWLPIPGWEGYYSISTYGQVKSHARKLTDRLGRSRHVPERILKPGRLDGGHHWVALWRDNQQFPLLVHRGVLTTFVGPCPTGLEGCHNNGKADQNYLSNLRWDTREANAQDTLLHGANFQANKTHCPQGHPYDDENTSTRSDRPTTRGCKTCERAAKRKYKARKRAERGEAVHYNTVKTHCKWGHEFTPENTRITKTGRACRECSRRRLREFKARQRGADV